jgi:hypothetical protein
MTAMIDLTGKSFNRLTVIRKMGAGQNGKMMWECMCSCGNKTVVTSYDIKTGHTASCGCAHNEQLSKYKKIHGMSGSNEFSIWRGMMNRCYNKNDPAFKYYGERGITVCALWKDSFLEFFGSMGHRPSKLYSIDRINNDGNYEPSNCRWATMSEQANNTRANKWIEFSGERLTIGMWSRKLGFGEGCLRSRIKRWGIDKALTTPRMRNNKQALTKYTAMKEVK